MNLKVSFSGMGPIKMKLAKLAGDLKNPQVPLLQSASEMYGETARNFADGGRPETWAPLSLMSLFIRAHRANNTKRTQEGRASHLSDSGRLKNSFVPWVGTDGMTFGVSTNVEYARLMQDGGISESSIIPITGFKRKKAKEAQNQKYFGDTGYTKKSVDYDLHLNGYVIPARPFFPRNLGELASWGYQAKIKRIFAEYFKTDL